MINENGIDPRGVWAHWVNPYCAGWYVIHHKYFDAMATVVAVAQTVRFRPGEGNVCWDRLADALNALDELDDKNKEAE